MDVLESKKISVTVSPIAYSCMPCRYNTLTGNFEVIEGYVYLPMQSEEEQKEGEVCIY